MEYFLNLENLLLNKDSLNICFGKKSVGRRHKNLEGKNKGEC